MSIFQLVRLLLVIPTWEEKLEKFAELLSVEINQPAETVSRISLCLSLKQLESGSN